MSLHMFKKLRVIRGENLWRNRYKPWKTGVVNTILL